MHLDRYTSILDVMDTEGSQLNKAWMNLPAPNIGKQYYKRNYTGNPYHDFNCYIEQQLVAVGMLLLMRDGLL